MKYTDYISNEGNERRVKNGFSFTVFLFGPFALFIRGQFLFGFIYLVLAAYSNTLLNFIFNTNIDYYIPVIYSTILSIFANKLLANSLVSKGYKEQEVSVKKVTDR